MTSTPEEPKDDSSEHPDKWIYGDKLYDFLNLDIKTPTHKLSWSYLDPDGWKGNWMGFGNEKL
jgi:hypothetical protein